MTDQVTKFDLGDFDAQDEADLAIKDPTTGKPTTWIWTFYGPGHPKTIELANKVSRDRLREISAQRQARVNGRKWKDEEQTPEQLREENIENIVARLKGFTPVDMGEGKLTFSPDNAKRLLLDRKKGWLLNQVIEWLEAEENFIRPSASS